MAEPYDPNPRVLCPDPQLGTRDGWAWCPRCGGIQPPHHVHPKPNCNRHLDCDRADDLAAQAHAEVEHCRNPDCAPLCTPTDCRGATP